MDARLVSFGVLEIDGRRYDHDVIIEDGRIRKRKKGPSKGYRERFGHREGEFPVCEDVAARALALPFFPELTEGQVERVAGALLEALAARPVRG